MLSVRSTRAPIRHFFLAIVLAVSGLLSSSRVLAQAPTSAFDASGEPDAPAHVSVIDGSATIDRDDEAVTAAAGEPLVDGDRLTTDRGRAEIWFADGSTLAVDERSSVELLSDTLLRVTSGRIYLTVARVTAAGRPARAANRYRIDLAAGSLVIDEPGEYSVSLTRSSSSETVDVAVIRGSALLHADNASHPVRGGERLVARADGAPYPERFNAARLDDFEQWAVSLHAGRRVRATSTQYLPANLRMYSSAFDQYGAWEHEPTHGYVWYPSVAAGWRPYYQGHWRSLPRHGWTWIATDRWGWPTHHYGRWGYGRSRWFWIPDRRWGPAWVSWASAADYVSWCPLGFNNRPVFNFSLSVGDTWAGWVVLPRRSFGAGDGWVSRHAFDGRRIPRSTAFAVHARAPMAPTFGSRAYRRVDDRFDRGRRRSGRDDGRGADRAIPRAGGSRGEWADNARDRINNRDSRGRRDDGWRAPWPDTSALHNDGSRRRQGGDRWYSSRPMPDDRPTPQNPRAGIRVDPGVPRAGDRLDPYADRPRYRTWSDRGSLRPPVSTSAPPNAITAPPNPITPPPGPIAVPRHFSESRSSGDSGGYRSSGPVGRPSVGDGGRPDGGPARAVPRGDAPSHRGGDGPPAGDGGGRRRGAR